MAGDEEFEDDTDYEALAAKLTDPNYPIHSDGWVLTGTEAAAFGREFLIREYGSIEAVYEAMGRGRPPVGSKKKGPSPTVRGRISVADFEQFQQLKTSTGKTESELVREAVHLLLDQRRAG